MPGSFSIGSVSLGGRIGGVVPLVEPARNHMLQSMILRSKAQNLLWGNSIQPVDTMTGVDPREPLFLTQFSTSQIHNYDVRDKELAYRDLVLGGWFLSVGYQASMVWGMAMRRLILPSYVSNVLYDNTEDRDLSVLASTPSHVDQVNSLSIPYRAFFVDKGLYSRDLVMLETMARICRIFSSDDRPLSQAEPYINIDNLWSHAGEQDQYTDIGLNIDLDRNTYGIPDRYQAKRDNSMATLIAEMYHELLNVYAISERLYIQVQGIGAREPEVYNLIYEDVDKRIFAAEPFLPDRLRITYWKDGRIQWGTEDYRRVEVPQNVNWGLYNWATLPSIFSFPGVEPDQTFNVVPEVPERYNADKGYGMDSEWNRQKAFHINFDSTKWRERQYEAVDAVNMLSNGIGSVHLNLTETLGKGVHRVSVKIRPSGTGIDYDINLFAVLNGITSNASVALVPDRPDVVAFEFNLPAAFYITDPTLNNLTVNLGSTLTNIAHVHIEGWDIRAKRTMATTVNAAPFSGWHAEIQDRVIEGIKNAYTDNLKLTSIIPEFRTLAGVEATPFVPYPVRINNPDAKKFTSNANSTIVRITASSGYSVGDTLVFVPSDDVPVTRQITYVWQENESEYTPGFVTVTVATPLNVYLPFSGTCWKQGTVVFTATGLPSGISINVYTGTFSGTFGPAISGDYTSVVTVAGAISATLTVLWHVHPLITPTLTNNLWTLNSTNSWLTSMTSIYEERLLTSHRIGRPYDIGRPALVPEGLYFTSEDELACSNNATRSIPVYRAFQPWMLDVGIYVMRDEFEGWSAVTVLDYIINSDGALYLQSPNLTWWQISPNVLSGEMEAVAVSYSGIYSSADFDVGTLSFGFSDAGGVWNVTVSSIGEVTTTRLLLCDAMDWINYNLAFANGYGPVFRMKSTSTDGRLQISDIGELQIEEI